ncbi:50S ribosomal protein L19 [candidate division KSB1 bacterium]
MNQLANQKGIVISPVNMENRKDVGIRVGDTVRVWQKIEEKGKTRLQAFEGLVLARKHGNEAGATFTVRRVSGGIGVEKIYPLYSPMIDKIEIVKRSKVRRAKLYHIREKVAREIKRQMRKMQMVDISTNSDTQDKADAEAQAKVDEEEKVAAEEAKNETNTEVTPEEGAGETVEEKKEETPVAEEVVEEKEEDKKEA